MSILRHLPWVICFCLLAMPWPAGAQQADPSVEATVIGKVFDKLKSLIEPDVEQAYKPTFGARSGLPVKEYIVGIHPLHNPKRLFEIYGPILELIGGRIPQAEFKLEASRNYEEFDKKLYSRHFDLAMPNPYQTVNALQYGYRVFGKMADDQDFCGIILVRKDSGIREVADLKGKAVAYPAKTALAATMLPQYYLQTHGIDVNTDIENLYVGSQESSIMNVLLGKTAAAATWPVPWKSFAAKHPEQAGQLDVKWRTQSLQNNGWVARDDVDDELVNAFAAALFSLQDTEPGRKLLAAVPVSRFEAADAKTYAPVEAFLQQFAATVRRPE